VSPRSTLLPPQPNVYPHPPIALLARFTTHSIPTSPARRLPRPGRGFHTPTNCPSHLIDLQLLSFHGLTNCFSRNPFIFRNICVAGGVAAGLSSILSSLRHVSALCGSALSFSFPFSFPLSRKKPADRHANSSSYGAPINTFRMNTCKSVSKQRTLTIFRMNTYAKRGRGVPSPKWRGASQPARDDDHSSAAAKRSPAGNFHKKPKEYTCI